MVTTLGCTFTPFYFHSRFFHRFSFSLSFLSHRPKNLHRSLVKISFISTSRIPYVESNFPFYHLFGNFLTIALDFNFLTAVDDTNILQKVFIIYFLSLKVILAFSQSQNQLFNIVQSIDQILLSVPIHQLNAYGFNGPPHLASTMKAVRFSSQKRLKFGTTARN